MGKLSTQQRLLGRKKGWCFIHPVRQWNCVSAKSSYMLKISCLFTNMRVLKVGCVYSSEKEVYWNYSEVNSVKSNEIPYKILNSAKMLMGYNAAVGCKPGELLMLPEFVTSCHFVLWQFAKRKFLCWPKNFDSQIIQRAL